MFEKTSANKLMFEKTSANKFYKFFFFLWKTCKYQTKPTVNLEINLRLQNLVRAAHLGQALT